MYRQKFCLEISKKPCISSKSWWPRKKINNARINWPRGEIPNTSSSRGVRFTGMSK